MLFSSISFIYYFLPCILFFYFITPNKYKNIILFSGSLLFYFFGEPKYTILLLFSIIINYLHSLVIDKYLDTKIAKVALISSISINVLILAFFKYSNFFIQNINSIFDINIKLLDLTLPLGISFFTFQTMSYIIDIYRGEAKISKNPLGVATYVSLFPQLIAGPIVRYKTVAEELNNRKHSFDNFAYGIKRFVIGLSKKVLIANPLGELYAIVTYSDNSSVLFYWIAAIAFALQIYFDFSGYSDMAIGLGRIFGFHFLENFNYPYISKSISEFWTRWHISLGSWFRDYVYIPLGGNRVSKLKWFRNIFVVWFLTGFWHGASWNFALWGLYFGVLVTLEKLFIGNLLKRIPNILNHIYVVFLIVISFVIFKIDNMTEFFTFFKGMFGLLDIPILNTESIYYLESYFVIIIIAIIGTTPLIKNFLSKTLVKYKIIDVLEPICYVILMIAVTGYLVDSSFNPFLYFRF